MFSLALVQPKLHKWKATYAQERLLAMCAILPSTDLRPRKTVKCRWLGVLPLCIVAAHPCILLLLHNFFHSVVNTCYIARHFMSILKELICTSTIILLVQGAPLLFQAFTYCIISKPSICDISQHSYISKEREATYSYYGTLQVSKYKVTILFSRSSCIKCKAFLYGTTAIATTLYAPAYVG